MTILISDIEINSIILETKQDENTGNTLNQAFVSTSLKTTATQKHLKSISLRLVVALTKEASRPIDFITQRYNEFMTKELGDISSHEYNDFLQQTLGEQENYLRSSSPFSPYSTNIEARNLVITNRVSIPGEGLSVAKDIIIYDIPAVEAISNIVDGVVSIDPIHLDLPATVKELGQISFYMLAYDTRVATFFKDSPIDNFSINTGMSTVAISTPLGDRVIFLSPSEEEPLVGMQEKTTVANPDADKLQSIEAPPTNAVIEEYTSIAERAQKLFTSYQNSKNYELNQVIKRENYFSDFWLARDTEDNHKFVFAFDVRSYLSKNGIFPFIYRNEDLSRMLISGGGDLSPDTLSSVRSVEVFRNPVEPQGVLATNDLGTTGRVVTLGPNNNFPKVLVQSVKKVDIRLPKIFSSENSDYRFSFFEGYDRFGVEDEANTQINGTYQYSAKCVIIDNSPEMLRKLADVILGLRRSTRLIYNHLVGNSATRGENLLYNADTARLRKDIKSIQANIEGESINVADKLLDNIKKYETFLNALNISGDRLELVNFYESNFKSANGKIKPAIIKDFEILIDLGIRFIYQKLEKIYPLDPFGRKDSLNRTNFAQNSSRTSKSNLSTIEHTFSGIYEKGKNSGYGLDYVFTDENNPGVLNNITLQDYQTRRIEEFKKYFSGGKGAAEIIPVGSYENPSYAYLTAKTIRTPDRPIIEQPDFASQDSTAVEYDFDRYGQLFADIVELAHQRDDLGMFYPSLLSAGGHQKPNNKIYSSTLTLLAEKFSVAINEVVIPQFSAPRVVRDGSKSTIYKSSDRETCGTDGGTPLIQSIIGGEDTQDATTETYLDQVNIKIKGEDTERNRGAIDAQAIANDKKERAIKLPFAILGELTLDKIIDTSKNHEQDIFNSLTALRNILNISKSDIGDAIGSNLIAQLPNQLKSMLVISSTDGVSSLGGSAGSQSFDACRPKLKGEGDSTNTEDLVSFFGDQGDISPYPQTENPMKTYARFLAFWMNYRQIAVVEYLNGFDSLKSAEFDEENQGPKLKLDSWAKMNASTAQGLLDQGGSILCRTRLMTAEDYLILTDNAFSEGQKQSLISFFETKELLNLPTYNQYFYIQSEASDEILSESLEEPSLIMEEPQAQNQSLFVVGY